MDINGVILLVERTTSPLVVVDNLVKDETLADVVVESGIVGRNLDDAAVDSLTVSVVGDVISDVVSDVNNKELVVVVLLWLTGHAHIDVLLVLDPPGTTDVDL